MSRDSLLHRIPAVSARIVVQLLGNRGNRGYRERPSDFVLTDPQGRKVKDLDSGCSIALDIQYSPFFLLKEETPISMNAQITFSKCRSSTRRDLER